MYALRPLVPSPPPTLLSAAFPCPPAEGARLPVGSHRRTAPSSGSDRSAVVALGLLSAAATALGAVPAAATPHDDTRAEVDRLYQEAEKATEAYNAADERADSLRRQIATAQDGIARKQHRVNSMRESLGTLAGVQYRSGGLNPPSPCCSPTTPRTTWSGPPSSTGSPSTRPASSAGSGRPCAPSPRTARRPPASSRRWTGAARPSPPTSGPSSASSPRPAGCSTPSRPPNAPPGTGPAAPTARTCSARPAPPPRAARPPPSPPPAPPSADPTCGAPTAPAASTAPD